MAEAPEAQNEPLAGDASEPEQGPPTGVAAPEPGAVAASEATAVAEAEPTASAESVSEGGSGDGVSDAAGAGDQTLTGDTGEAGSEPGASSGEPGEGKRKRRRRKKRKGDVSEAGGESAPSDDAAAAPRPPKKREASNAPFLRFFVGSHGGRKHGFSVGEVVAGRVRQVDNGTIAIDLFGKAMAYADEFEPREIPPIPEQPREPVLAPPPAEASATATDAAVPSEATTVTGGPAPEPAAADTASSDAEAAATETETAEAAPTDTETGASSANAELAPDVSDAEPDAGADESETEGEGEGEATLSGDDSPLGHGPLPPAPVVPGDLPRPELPQLGQVFRGRVGALSESGHIAIVNRLVDRQAVLANMERYRRERRRVQGLVFGFNRGGFDVIVEGTRAFCPASAMTLEELADPLELVGQKLEFLLPSSQTLGKDIIVSRRSILERLARKKARELLKTLKPGQRLKGKVTGVREFGLFVDIGGVEGLVHQSELSFTHGVQPHEVAKEGDEVDVQVLRVGGDPRRGPEAPRRDRMERVSLSIKALLPDPWDAHGDALAEGSARAGKITRTTDFGAFVELVPQVEGLLHITELGRDLKHANQVVKEGDEVFVVIERVDKGTRRISLSKLTPQEMTEYEAAKQAGGEPAQSVRPGNRIKVKVVRADGRGLVVRVTGVFGRRARGYIPASEMGERSGDLRKSFPQGSEIEVKVVGLDRDGGLRCSPKALQVDDERRAVKDYRREAAKQGFGTFGDLLRAKLGDTK